MGEISRGSVRVLEDASLSWSKELILVEACLEEPPFEELCGDVMMGGTLPRIGPNDLICNEPLDLTPISSPLHATTHSHPHAFHESLDDIGCYNPSVDPYFAFLADVPRKIMRSTFFDHTFDFSMAFDEFKRPLTLLALSFVVFSYSHHRKINAIIYDMLLRALTPSKLRTRLLSDWKERLMLLAPNVPHLSET